MQIYYPSLKAIHQQTLQLDNEQCKHCHQTHQLISHGFIRKKQVGAAPEAVGKRVFCSNRNRRSGCGRTTQLYLDATLRYLHYAGQRVVMFVLSRIVGTTIQQAYEQATGTINPRNAYRWLDKLFAQLSHYRSLFYQPPLQDADLAITSSQSLRWQLLISTFNVLLRQFRHSLCSAYQHQLQRSFL